MLQNRYGILKKAQADKCLLHYFFGHILIAGRETHHKVIEFAAIQIV